MEEWSILSNVINYIQHDRHPMNFYNLNIISVNKEKYKGKSNRGRGETNARVRFWRYAREVKGRILRCIQRNPIRNIKHYQI